MGLEEESRFMRLGVSPPSGVLLYGPAGCGKTALGLALAQATQANFIPIHVWPFIHSFIHSFMHIPYHTIHYFSS